MNNQYRLSFEAFDRETETERVQPYKIFFLSVEGNKSEVEYFTELSKYRETLGISAGIDVEVLRRDATDTNSDPQKVIELLEEYLRVKSLGMDKILEKIPEEVIAKYNEEIIRQYLYEPEALPEDLREDISCALHQANYDLLYMHYLLARTTENDEFAIVIDRDRRAHKEKNMQACIQHCKENSYGCYISNPCFEFWLLLHLTDVKKEYADRMNDILENKRLSENHTFVSKEVSKLAGHGKKNLRFKENYLENINVAIQRAKAFASDEEQLIFSIGTNVWKLIEKLRETSQAVCETD